MRYHLLLPLAFSLQAVLGCTATSPAERVAHLRALEAESAARLASEGALLFDADTGKKDGYAYCSIAVGLIEQGELRLGIREASKALFLGRSGGDRCMVASAERDLASAYGFAGLLDRAKEFSEGALTDAAGCRNYSSIVIRASRTLGGVLLREGRPKEAIARYEAALTPFDTSVDAQLTRVALANAYVASGDLKTASEILARLEAQSLGSSPGSAVHRARAHLLLQEGKPREAATLFEHAVTASTGGDSAYQRLWALDGLARARLAAGDPAAAADAYRQAIEAAEQVRARFRSEEFRAGFFASAQQVYDGAIALLLQDGSAGAALEVSEKSRARALQDMLRGRVQSKAGAEVIADPVASAFTSRALQGALPSNTVLVEYHVLPSRTYAWVVRRSGVTAVDIATRESALRADVGRLRRAILSRSPDARMLARRLHEQLVAPLGLSDTEALVVVPHGPLHYLPFQALYGPRGYMVEERPISYAPSASIWLHLLSKELPRRGQPLALGNPDLGTPRLGLPGAQREVVNIKNLYPDAEIYLGAEATKQRLLVRAPSKDLLHVAAHAEVDEVDPLYSVIRLAAADGATGQLEAHEIYDLNLTNMSLTVLSACDSGLGRVSGGDEVWGFTRSFLAAGTRSLLVSLWPVEDESTARLMEQFYLELRGTTLREALRSAQLHLLRDLRTSDPFFWAAFDLIGDPR